MYQQPGLNHNAENEENRNPNGDVVGQQGGQQGSPASRQKMKERKDLRNLNNRLTLYVQNQSKQRSTIESLKQTLAKQEIEFRNRIRDKENQFNQINEKLRAENETLQYQTKQFNEEIQTLEASSSDFQRRVEQWQKLATEKDSEIEGLKHQITVFSQEMKSLRTENAEIKYKYENHDSERKKLVQQFKQLKEKNSHLMKDLTKRQSENRSQCESFNRMLTEKTNENDRLVEENRFLLQEKSQLQERLREEFDKKIKEFVEKREEQYKQEKEEWMRIFKDEFNQKLRGYKNANLELNQNNSKLEEEIIDLQSRLNKLKQSKSEYELSIRNLEQENEKIRHDFDTMRKMKDLEIKNKGQLINELHESRKQRDIEFDEVVGIKIQLAQEIELYRKILSEAEQSAGYNSPLNPSGRKKRRLNKSEAETLGMTATPGMVRGAQIARRDLSNFAVSGTDTENELANDGDDEENDSLCNGDDIDTELETDNENDNNIDAAQSARNMIRNHRNRQSFFNNNNNNSKNNKNNKIGQKRGRNDMYIDDSLQNEDDGDYKDDESNGLLGNNNNDINDNGLIVNNNNNDITPGGEPWPLQFSTMDLTRSIIELQNISDAPVSLRGYTLSNMDGAAQFPLPSDRILEPNEKVQIKIGLRAKSDGNKSVILWKADVWTGDEDDVARLYDPNQVEIARIDITPDMLPSDVKKNNGNCIIM